MGMTPMTVIMNGHDQQALAELGIDEEGRIVAIAALPEATANGLPGAIVVVQLADGRKVAGTTTLALLEGGVLALCSRHGSVREQP